MLRRQKTAAPRGLREGWRLEFIGRESIERRESRLPVARPGGILWETGGGTAMPYPMVHLLTARRWAAEKPDLLENPEFYLGAISPDAIHMRPGVGRPDKHASHLDVLTRGPEAALNSLAGRSGGFDTGYCLHILTDFYWFQHVQRTYPRLVQPDGAFIPDIYYPDCDLAEEGLYRESLERAGFWDLLGRAMPPEGHPLLSGGEIDLWRKRVLGWRGSQSLAPAKVITLEAVRGFIDGVQPILKEFPI